MTGRAVALPFLAMLVFLRVSTAGAQSTMVVTPSVSVGSIYDENIFWSPQPQSDYIWQVEPRIDLLRTTARSRLWLETSMNAAWHSGHRALSSSLARQSASTDWAWNRTAVETVGITGGYWNTTDPADADFSTGLSLGRLRTFRWMVAPEYTRALTPRLATTVRYRAHLEFASTVADLSTHSLETEARWQHGQRDELRLAYTLDRFGFERAAVLSHRPAAFWVRRVTALTDVMVGGGVNATAARIRPTIAAAVSHRSDRFDTAISYAWSQAASLGVDGLLDVQRVFTTVRYGRPGATSTALLAGVYRTVAGDTRIDVWRAGLDVSRPLWRALSVAGSYVIDVQRNALTATTLSPTDSFPLLSYRQGRRSVLAIRLVLTGPVFASIARRERPVDIVRDPHQGGLQ